MNRVVLFLGFGLFIASLNGCYTIVSNSNNVNADVHQTTIINYPPPPPVISPIIIYPPSPPSKHPVITRPPEERPKWKPSDRDPLRGHGDRGNQKIVSDRIKRDDNNSVNRR